MKRSLQEILELVVFGLIAIVVGMLLLWGAGWVFTWLGLLLRYLGGFIWLILKYIIPVAIVALVVYFLVKLVMNQQNKPAAASSDASATPAVQPATTPATAPAAPAAEASETAEPVEAAPTADAPPPSKVDNAEPVDTDVDTSGFKEVDDEAEAMEDEDDNKNA